MRKAICLIRPPAAECVRFATTSITPPLGLAYIAAALEAADWPVTVIDAVSEAPAQRTRYITGYLIGLSLHELAERVPTDADLVGISVIFTHEWPAVVRLIELIKQRAPQARIVVGGEHVTSLPEFVLMSSQVDYVILGEGEETIVALAASLEDRRPLTEVDGLGFRGESGIVINRRRRRKRDVDAIAWPAWHLFKLDVYHAHRFVGGIYNPSLTVPILATRGCPYQCTYCSAPSMWTPQWIPRDPVKVVDEIEHYVQHYGARNFPFQDLTAIVQKDWIVRFCRELIARGLEVEWQLPSGTRSEAIDGEVAGLLRRAGMTNMAYAPESGAENTRRFIKKKMHTEQLFKSIHSAVGAGLNVSLFMVLGLPHDSSEDIAQNLAFLADCKRAGVKDISVSFYMALPGTELFDWLFDRGKIVFDRTYFCHMLHNLALVPKRSYSDHLGRAELTLWKARLFLRFYRTRHEGRARAGLLRSVARGLSGLRAGGHSSKLQTAFRNAFTSMRDTALTRLKAPWISQEEERRLFERWDPLYREIRRARLASGVSPATPADSRELHQHNVARALQRDHGAGRIMRSQPSGSAAQRLEILPLAER